MIGIRIFFPYSRTRFKICNPCFITVITAEARSGVIIPAISHIVELQGITIQKDSVTPLFTFPDIIRIGRIRSHPETIQITQSVSFFFYNYARVIFNRYPSIHLFFSPESKPFGRNDFGRITDKCHFIIRRLRFDLPIFMKLADVEPGNLIVLCIHVHSQSDEKEQKRKYVLHTSISYVTLQK